MGLQLHRRPKNGERPVHDRVRRTDLRPGRSRRLHRALSTSGGPRPGETESPPAEAGSLARRGLRLRAFLLVLLGVPLLDLPLLGILPLVRLPTRFFRVLALVFFVALA